MDNLRISEITAPDFYTIQKVLASGKITDSEKAQFIRKNSAIISQEIENHITSKDFQLLMKNRPLIKYRPLKNSYTKRGDKILLAKSLEIEPSNVDGYIKNMTLEIESKQGILSIESSPYDSEKIEKVKTYVFRHGTKDQVVRFLNYELQYAKDILKLCIKY